MADGEAKERIQYELEKIADNILDLMTEPDKKRTLTIKIDYIPNEKRNALETQLQVTSKLAPQKKAETTTLIGRDVDTGFIQMQELQNGGIPGQTFLDDDGTLKTDVGEEIDEKGNIREMIDYNKKRNSN